MQQRFYAKEPFDTKLFVLLFLKKIWLVVCAAILGAALIGGGYYLKKVVFGGPTEYEMTTTYFIEYTTYNEETGEIYNYTNSATWGSLVLTDWFIDRAWEYALEAGMVPQRFGTGIEKSDLAGYFYATMPTDLRIPEATVTTPYEELTMLLNTALQKTFFEFAEGRSEMEKIAIIDETELAVADKDVRTLRAVILGAVLGGLAAGFGLALWLIWDDTMQIPESLSYRYGLPAAGALAKGDTGLSEEVLLNVKYLLRNKTQNGLVAVGKGIDIQKLMKQLPEGLFTAGISSETFSEEGFEKLRKAGGVLLLAEAGAAGGKEVEHVLETLKLQEISVVGGLLCNADKKLIACYRLGTGKRA